jgi:signal transduction histidine kinase
MNAPATPRLRKLTPAIALVSVIALLGAGVLIARFTDRSTDREQVSEVSAQARVLAATVTAALAFNDHKAAQEYVNAIHANPEVEVAAIYDANGKLFVSYPPKGASVPPTVAPSPPRFAGDRLQIAVPVVQQGIPLGTVYLRSFTEPLARRVQRYGVIALLVTMASVVVAVLGVTHRALNRANDELATRAAELADANQNLQAQIAQREQAEETLRQAQKMEAIGQLTGGVAHDFNNLLQVILGNLERLRSRLPRPASTSEEEPRRLAEAATRAATRAATLTQRLLAFSRRQPLMPTTLDVNRLVVGMSELISRTLGETIRTETVLSGNVWRVSADENQLENALLNLAVNARDAMSSGGRLTIETRNVTLDEGYARSQDDLQPGDYVQIAMTDTGTGMPKDVVDRAFDPFFTTKGIGQGTGLGLSQVYGFVKQSGGHVRIYSEAGQGTTVKLYLPRQAVMTPPPNTTVPALVPRAALDETILVVEDEPDVRVFAGETLRGLGYGVREAGDGKTALDIIDHEPALSLLFTDVGLPGGLSGRELADEVKRRRPALKVLFTTGYARDALMHNGRLETGVELLRKPFNAMDLAKKVRAVLDL